MKELLHQNTYCQCASVTTRKLPCLFLATIANSIQVRKILNISQTKQSLLKVFWLKCIIQENPSPPKIPPSHQRKHVTEGKPCEKEELWCSFKHTDPSLKNKPPKTVFLMSLKAGISQVRFYSKACSSNRVSSWRKWLQLITNLLSWFHLDSVSNL